MLREKENMALENVWQLKMDVKLSTEDEQRVEKD